MTAGGRSPTSPPCIPTDSGCTGADSAVLVNNFTSDGCGLFTSSRDAEAPRRVLDRFRDADTGTDDQVPRRRLPVVEEADRRHRTAEIEPIVRHRDRRTPDTPCPAHRPDGCAASTLRASSSIPSTGVDRTDQHRRAVARLAGHDVRTHVDPVAQVARTGVQPARTSPRCARYVHGTNAGRVVGRVRLDLDDPPDALCSHQR